VRLVFIREAAAMLGVNKMTLRRRLSPDRHWVEIYGGRLKVYPLDSNPTAKLRLDADEINRLLLGLKKGRPPVGR
jgi:hypothetical protein